MNINRGPITVTSSSGSPLLKVSCLECGSEVLASKNDKFCTVCGSGIEVKKTGIKIEASVKDLRPSLLCATCENKIYVSDKEDPVHIATTMYCPVCGSAEIDMVEEEVIEPEEVIEEEVIEPEEEVEEEVEEEEEEEVQDKLGDIEVDELEAALLAKPEDHWMIFSNGEPLLRFLKSNQPEESHAIFSTSKFFDFFQQRAKETSLFGASREFNAELIIPDKIMTTSDVEEVVYDRLQSTVLPKFLDCTSLAIEGMVRNIYPDLSLELKASFYDELRARGIAEPNEVVEAVFDAAGSKVFAAIVAKAMELYNKPDEIRSELKSTILSTEKATNVTVNEEKLSEDDVESIEVKAKLRDGNIPLKETVVSNVVSNRFAKASVNDLRDRISLGRRKVA